MINKILIKIDNLEVQLPETHIIVEKDEYLNLKKKASEVLEMVSVSRPWLLENVLYKQDIRSRIDVERNKEGFVKYPESQGGRYYFLASKTKQFFEENFAEIFRL